MRWFKHLCDASADEWLLAIEQDFGLEGYARWFKLCEAIGKRIKGERAALSLPVASWCQTLRCKPKVLLSFLFRLENEGRIKVIRSGNVLEIELPKLLKYRDEYQKKSGHAPVETPDKVPLQNTEYREEKNLKKNHPSDGSKKDAETEKRPKRREKLPDDWKPDPSDVDAMRAECPSVDLRAEHRLFRDWARGNGAVKLDWRATWRNWMRRAAKDQRRRGGVQVPQQPARKAADVAPEVAAMINRAKGSGAPK